MGDHAPERTEHGVQLPGLSGTAGYRSRRLHRHDLHRRHGRQHVAGPDVHGRRRQHLQHGQLDREPSLPADGRPGRPADLHDARRGQGRQRRVVGLLGNGGPRGHHHGGGDGQLLRRQGKQQLHGHPDGCGSAEHLHGRPGLQRPGEVRLGHRHAGRGREGSRRAHGLRRGGLLHELHSAHRVRSVLAGRQIAALRHHLQHGRGHLRQRRHQGPEHDAGQRHGHVARWCPSTPIRTSRIST